MRNHSRRAMLKTAMFVTSLFTVLQPVTAEAKINNQTVVQDKQDNNIIDERFLPSNKAPFIMPKKVEVVNLGETEEILY